MLRKFLALGLVLSVAGVANAAIFGVDNFGVDQGPISDLTVNATPVSNTLGIAPFRTLSTNLLASGGPVTNIVQVSGGVLDITNGTSEDSQVISSVTIAANSLPGSIQNVFFLLDVVASDGNPTQIQVFLNGFAPVNQLGSTAFVPGNTFNTGFTFGPLTNAEIAAIQAGGTLHLVLDGAPGWDATFDQFGFSFDLPEPASMGLAFVGVAALAFRRRR